MTNDPRPYPDYKESGLTWLGQMPAHWDVRRNGRLFAQRNETGYGSLPILEVSLKTGVRVRDMDDRKRKQIMSDREKYKRAAKGDIAYNMMRMWQGAVGVAPVDGLVSPAYVVARPRPDVESRYFSYLFRTDAYMNEVDGYSRGIVKDRNRLYWEDFKRMPCCAPPPQEQKAIADYLDGNAAMVRRFIRNRLRLIDLLDEQKQAIINRVVTRGLDVSVRLAPSDINWLGDVPEHWEVGRLKNWIGPVEQGWSPQCDAQPAGMDEWGVMKVGCANKGYFDASQNKKLPDNLAPIPSLEIRDGDVLVSRANTRELLGSAAVAQAPRAKLILCDKLYRFRTFADHLRPHFLVHVLRCRSSRTQIESSTNGASSSMQNIGRDVVRNLWIAVPPLGEQDALVQMISTETNTLSVAIDCVRREVDLIRDYRTRLIADVVTGKVDVQQLAPVAVAPAPGSVEPLGDEEEPADEIAEDEDGEPAEEVANADD